MRTYKVIFYFYTGEAAQATYNSNALIFISPAGQTGAVTPVINNILSIVATSQSKKFIIKANKNEVDVTNYYLYAPKKLFVITKQYD